MFKMPFQDVLLNNQVIFIISRLKISILDGKSLLITKTITLLITKKNFPKNDFLNITKKNDVISST